MFFKRILLLVASIIGMLILFNTEFYQRWFSVYLFPEHVTIASQFEKQSVEERREIRFGNTYNMVNFIKKTLDTTKIKNAETIILLPPNEYLAYKHLEMFHLPEPAEFYYHSGIKAVWTTSPDVEKANWVILPQGAGSLVFIPITSADMRHQILDSFKRFKPSL